MLIAAIVLICLGLSGLALGIAPDGALGLIAAVLPDAPADILRILPQGLIAVSGAIYLSGIVLLAGALLKRTAVVYLEALVRQRSDLESLQGAVLAALERLELEHRQAASRQHFVSTEMRHLAQEFERANAAGWEEDPSLASADSRQ